jgi:hypothetical protein
MHHRRCHQPDAAVMVRGVVPGKEHLPQAPSILNPNSQIEGRCSVPIRWTEVASIETAQEQNSAPENCFTVGFELLPSNPPSFVGHQPSP